MAEETMTAQEVFDAVVAHLVQQGAKCGDEDRCYYRGPVGSPLEGMKCAVGALISDEEYVSEMDDPWHSSSAHGLMTRGLLPERLVPTVMLLNSLQRVHDSGKDWVDGLQRVAGRYRLNAALVPSGGLP